VTKHLGNSERHCVSLALGSNKIGARTKQNGMAILSDLNVKSVVDEKILVLN
jgi:hypothetical protein